MIALTFVLTVEDKNRFAKSREVGCYVGLRPKRRDSGESQPQLGISKEGDSCLGKLLVQGAHVILSKKGPDTDLKRLTPRDSRSFHHCQRGFRTWGFKLAERGGKNAKKRAIVAVARKLAVLMHCL